MRETTIMVTGASGFIGRHVLTALAAQGVHVVALTRNAQKLTGSGSPVTIVEWDIREGGKSLFERAGRPEALLHLAWSGLSSYSSVVHAEEVPVHFAFLQDLISEGLPQLVVAGTCLEYGLQSGRLTEDVECRPVTAYGKAKHDLHRRLVALQSAHRFALTWARLFYVYGEGQAERALYSQLKSAVAGGDKHFDLSGGEQIRDYLLVEEAARLLVKLAILPRGAGAINVCSGAPVSVKYRAQQWCREHDWRIDLRFGVHPYPDYEPMEFWGDRSRLDAILEER